MNKLILFNNTSTVDSGSSGVQDPAEVVDEQIAIFDADNPGNGTLNLTGANATTRMLIAQGGDDHPVISQIFNNSDVVDVIEKNYSAYVNQVTHVGFNGTDGDITVATNGDAFVKLTRLEKGFEQFPRATSDASVDSSNESYDNAKTLAENLNSLGGAKSFARAEVLVNDTASNWTDGGAGDVTVDVTEGSDVVIANVASGQSAGVSVGDYIRIGGTAKTDEVYKVTSVETNDGAETALEIGIDRPYGGVTASGLDGGVLDNGITGNEAGLEITAKDLDEVTDYVESYSAISFHTAASEELDGTEVRVSTTPQTGTGTYTQVRAMEEQYAGLRSGYYNRNYFPQEPEFYADENTNYDIVTIRVELDNDNAVVSQNRYLDIATCWDTGANIGTQLSTFFGV